jgi:ABC-type long-subunit fatty acid transport system fused permease/ATPase subunit
MYTALLHTHNMFRWLVLISLVLAVIFAFAGWFAKKRWTKRDNLSGLLLTIFMDIQFLVGVALYAFVSPVTKAAFNDFGAAMKNDIMRFYAVEHISLMIIALVFVHIGRAKSKKAGAPWKQHRAAAIYFGISLVLILAAIPWDRAFV